MIKMAETTLVMQGITFLASVFEPLLTTLAVAIIIILAGFVLGRIVGKLIQRVLNEIELNNIIKKAVGIKIRLEESIGLFVTYFIYFVAIVMALGHLGLQTYILHIISGAVLLLIVLSIFLGIKDFIPNVMAGLFIHRKGFLNEGDNIQYNDLKGKIIKLNLLETRIQTKGGDVIYIPNSILVKTEVKKVKKL